MSPERGGPALPAAGTVAGAARGGTFRSLRIPAFRSFFGAQGISFVGSWLQLIAMGLLVLRLTDSGVALGLLTVFQFGPVLVLGAWAGVVLDRVDTRRLLLVTQVAMAASSATLGLLVVTDTVTLPLVYAVALVIGTVNAFDNPARRVFVNELVPAEHVANAVSLNSTVLNVARLIGPAAAGLLIAGVGIGWCFLLNALSFVAPFVVLRRLDPALLRTPPRVAKGRHQLRDGLRYAWSVDELKVPLLLLAVVGTLSYNAQVLLPLFATRDLGIGESGYTLLSSVFGVGALGGSLWLARHRGFGTRLLGFGALALGVASAAVAVAPTTVLALPALAGMGFSSIVVLSGANTVLQLAVSDAMRGRVLSLFTLVLIGSTPIGGPIAGNLAEAFGARVGIMLGAVAALVGGAAVVVHARRHDAADALDLPAGVRAPEAA